MPKSIIFSAYFTSERDPQRNEYWERNRFETIQPLYDSVKALGLNMIIFHDSLNREFRSEYTTDKITFKKYNPSGKNATTERFVCYLRHMEENKYSKILCLDCGDVEVYKDPFPLIDNIIIGSENGLIKDSPWVKDRFLKAYDNVYHHDKKILNCGIIGGRSDILLSLFTKFEAKVSRSRKNIDMAIFNKLIHDGIKYETGYPIHTVFTKNEGPESGCYIRHK